jgi:hypothetical protein
MIPGRSEYRALVDAGTLVPAYLVVGQLVPDGAVELLQIDMVLTRCRNNAASAVPPARSWFAGFVSSRTLPESNRHRLGDHY